MFLDPKRSVGIESFKFLAVNKALDLSVLILVDKFQGMRCDGLIGFSVQTFGNDNQELFIDDLKNKGVIDQRVFTMYLGTNDSCYPDDWSTLWLGQAVIPNGAKVSWLEVETDSKYWEVPLGRYSVGGYTFTPKNAKTVILDTGSSISSLSSSDLLNLLLVLEGYSSQWYYLRTEALYLCDCEKNTYSSVFPDITFTLGTD